MLQLVESFESIESVGEDGTIDYSKSYIAFVSELCVCNLQAFHTEFLETRTNDDLKKDMNKHVNKIFFEVMLCLKEVRLSLCTI